MLDSYADTLLISKEAKFAEGRNWPVATLAFAGWLIARLETFYDAFS